MNDMKALSVVLLALCLALGVNQIRLEWRLLDAQQVQRDRQHATTRALEALIARDDTFSERLRFHDKILGWNGQTWTRPPPTSQESPIPSVVLPGRYRKQPL